MSNSGLITQLRQKALDTLQESSELFELAFGLLQKGDLQEAENTKELARSKRNDSLSLMREANSLEEKSVTPENSPVTTSR